MSESVAEQSTDEIEVNEGNDNLNKTQDEEAEEEGQKEKLIQLPLSRVKNIAKVDPDVNLINADATFLIAKSTVIFFSKFRQYYQNIIQLYDQNEI